MQLFSNCTLTEDSRTQAVSVFELQFKSERGWVYDGDNLCYMLYSMRRKRSEEYFGGKAGSMEIGKRERRVGGLCVEKPMECRLWVALGSGI